MVLGDLVFMMLGYHAGKICHLISLDFSHLLCTPLKCTMYRTEYPQYPLSLQNVSISIEFTLSLLTHHLPVQAITCISFSSSNTGNQRRFYQTGMTATLLLNKDKSQPEFLRPSNVIHFLTALEKAVWLDGKSCRLNRIKVSMIKPQNSSRGALVWDSATVLRN